MPKDYFLSNSLIALNVDFVNKSIQVGIQYHHCYRSYIVFFFFFLDAMSIESYEFVGIRFFAYWIVL